MAIDCSPQALMTAAVPLSGIPDGQIDSIITYLLCQYANGGVVPPPFDPSMVSGLNLRLESSSLTGLANGDPVNSWVDTGPNGWNFDDASSAHPNITTNVFGTLPGVTFDNVVNTMNLGNTFAATLGISQNVSGITIFTVAKWNGSGSNGDFQFVFIATTNGTNNNARAAIGLNLPNWISRARRLDADAGAQSTTAATANVGVVVVSQIDYVGGTATVWLQGVAGTPQALASSGGNSSNTTSGSTDLGADGSNSAPPGGDG